MSEFGEDREHTQKMIKKLAEYKEKAQDERGCNEYQIPLKTVYSDPTAAIIHIQGNFLLHIAMIFGLLFVGSGSSPDESTTPKCQELYSTFQSLLELMLSVHFICFVTVILTYMAHKSNFLV